MGALFLLAVTASKIQSVAWSSFLFFLLVALLVEFLPIELPTGQHLTLSAAVGITILTNYGWPMAIWVATISVLMEAAFRRTPYYRALFNASQYVLTMSAAGAAFILSGGEVGVVDFTRPLPLLAVLVIDFLCNTILISGLFALLSQRGIVKVWTEMVKDSYQSSLATLVIGLVSARILDLDGLAGYTVLLVFLFMLQRIFQTYFKLFRATEEKRSELEAVLNATESGILMVDTGGKVRIMNRRIEEIFGHPENRPLGLDHAAAQSGPPNAEFETHLTGGVRKIIRRFSSPVVNKDGQLLGTVLSFTDITAEREAALRLQELQHASIRALVAAVDARDPYTHGHSERVSEYAVLLAREIGLPDQEVEVIRYAALLHDIGKIGLNDHILRKSSPLNLEERALVIQHPTKGVSILEENTAFANLIPMVKHHHEWYRGGGYPSGIEGEAIPLGARILAIADAFDAMTSDRPYRRALSLEMAVEQIRLGRGTQFDPYIADRFLSLVQQGKIHPHQTLARDSLSTQGAIPAETNQLTSKRIQDLNPVIVLASSKVLGPDNLAAKLLGALDDHGVPE